MKITVVSMLKTIGNVLTEEDSQGKATHVRCYAENVPSQQNP